MSKIIIAGSRGFNNGKLLDKTMDYVLSYLGDSQPEIVSGGARGADHYGEVWARVNGYHTTLFLADWDNHGKAAGFIRNAEMADYADFLVCFWDGQSSGTRHMFKSMKKAGKPYLCINYSPHYISNNYRIYWSEGETTLFWYDSIEEWAKSNIGDK